MKFKILELHKDTIPHLTASFSDLVSNVRYSLTEVVGNTTASVEFVQPMNFYNWDSSSFSEYSNLTEEQVKGWVTSSYEVRKTQCKTKDGKIHPTGSWSEFVNSVSSSLHSQYSNNLPW